jgi:6-phosphogluconolactonase
MNGRLDIQPTADELIRVSAERIASLLSESVQSRGMAMFALSGGSTPQSVYSILGSEPLRSGIPWPSVHLFWGDERCVPPGHPQSNYRMVNETLLQHVDIPSGNVHRLKGELDPAMAAKQYEEEIRQTFQVNEDKVPRFDVILLGLGEDGHTASLFPNTPALKEQQKLVTEVYIEKLKTHRITLTFPVINNAYHVLFLVSGKGKAGILSEVLQGNSVSYPAQHVRPVAGELQWLVDQDAASRLALVSER